MADICEQREHFTDIFRLIKDRRIRKGGFYGVKNNRIMAQQNIGTKRNFLKITIAPIRFEIISSYVLEHNNIFIRQSSSE